MTTTAWIVAALSWYVASRLAYFAGMISASSMMGYRGGNKLLEQRFWRIHGWRLFVPVITDAMFMIMGIIVVGLPLLEWVQGHAAKPQSLERLAGLVRLSSGLASVWGALWLSSMLGMALCDDPSSATWPSWVHGFGLVGVLALTYESITAVKIRVLAWSRNKTSTDRSRARRDRLGSAPSGDRPDCST